MLVVFALEPIEQLVKIGADGVRRHTVFKMGGASGAVEPHGALLAQTTQFVGLDVLGFPRSAELMIMLVLGGTGRLYGALIGAAVFMVAQDYISGLDPAYWQFYLGLLLVFIVLFARGGILGGAVKIYERFKPATRREPA